MTPRLDFFKNAPQGAKALIAVENAISASGLEHSLLEIVRLRASQMNGCAFCIHMHVQDALAHGEDPMRLHLVAAWRDSPLFNDRERAALSWTEALTRVGKTHAPDEDYALVRKQFSDAEIANLTLLIASINSWNRIQIGLRAVHPVVDTLEAA